MSNNLSKGPVQVFSLDVASLNWALRELGERIDELSGLRGRTLLWDRAQVTSPTVGSDAVDLGSLIGRESLFHLTLYVGGTGLLALKPGTTYVEISNLYRQQVNFATPTSLEGRMIVSGFGTGTGSGKGVALTQSDGSVIAEVTWDGNTEDVRVGDFTSVSLAVDTLAQLRVKGADANESLILRHVAVEFRFDSGSSVVT